MNADLHTHPQPSGGWNETRLPLVLQAGAGIIGAAYACGLLVILLHHAKYGVYDMDLLRPRVFLAGFAFLVLLAAGLWLVLVSLGKEIFDPSWVGSPWAAASNMLSLAVASLAAVFALGPLLVGRMWGWQVVVAVPVAMAVQAVLEKLRVQSPRWARAGDLDLIRFGGRVSFVR